MKLVGCQSTGQIAYLYLKMMVVEKERTPSYFCLGFLSWLPELAAHFAISAAIAHALLA